MLYECRGLVSYCYRGSHTEYHGSFRSGPDVDSLLVTFNCRGDASKLKTVSLLKRNNCTSSGWDYNERWVVWTHVGTSVYCEKCNVWKFES